MKDLYKNPNFYYIFVPAVVTLCAILVWAVSVPAADEKWNRKKTEYSKAGELITRILEMDPERIDYEKQKGRATEFDYTNMIDKFSKTCDISPSDYSLRTGMEIKRRGQKSKSADLKVDPVSIEQFCKFLSLMLLQYSDLQCDQLKLTKVKAGPDTWKATLKLTYYY